MSSPTSLSFVSLWKRANFPFHQPCLFIDFRAASRQTPILVTVFWHPKWNCSVLAVSGSSRFPGVKPLAAAMCQDGYENSMVLPVCDCCTFATFGSRDFRRKAAGPCSAQGWWPWTHCSVMTSWPWERFGGIFLAGAEAICFEEAPCFFFVQHCCQLRIFPGETERCIWMSQCATRPSKSSGSLSSRPCSRENLSFEYGVLFGYFASWFWCVSSIEDHLCRECICLDFVWVTSWRIETILSSGVPLCIPFV